MQRLRGLLIVVVAVAASASTALADTVDLGWQETAKRNGHAQLTFSVRSIKFGNGSWTVTATFKNVTKTTVRVGTNYGLLLLRTNGITEAELAKGEAHFAMSFSKPLPAVLGPGQSWTGTFSGTGTPPTGAYVRVIFGRFTGGFAGPTGFYWVTDHSYKFSLLPSQTA